jgi:hypothetical protein
MTNRTVEINGSVTVDGNPSTGFITATLNGTTVFSGSVPTAGNPTVLFTFEVDMALAGSIPMSLTIENCNVYMSGILANYTNLGPVIPPTDPVTYSSSGPTGYLDTDPGTDSRANVSCTGAAYCSPAPPDPRPEGTQGTWGWTVDTATGTPAIFSYDLQIIAGVE